MPGTPAVIEGRVLKVGDAVVRQAEDTSLDNTNPVAFRGFIVQFVGAIVSIFVLLNVITAENGETLVNAIGDATVAVLVAWPIILGVIQIVVTRLKAYAPRTAAASAVASAAQTPPLVVAETMAASTATLVTEPVLVVPK